MIPERPRPRPYFAATLIIVTALGGCRRPADVVVRPDVPATIGGLALRGQFSIPVGTRVPPTLGLRFGGISGLAAVEGGAELLAVSDDRSGLRIYRLAPIGEGANFRVEVREQFTLQGVPAALGELDPEGIAVLPNGNLVIASEGVGGREPRVPPALVEFGRYGSYIRALPVRERFNPNPTGPQVRGVRPNKGFESLTLAPGGERLFTAVETALVQDGGETTFERGAATRILEYVRTGGGYRPARELVYMVEPIYRPSFEPGVAVNGLVELLALDGQTLLALERSFVDDAGGSGRNMNRIRLFRVSLAGATDVSALDSLEGVAGIVPVTKAPLLDVSDVHGLSPDLAPGLDNFEGMAFTGPLQDQRRGFVLVSDDNFNPTQRTWFLQFAVEGGGMRPQVE